MHSVWENQNASRAQGMEQDVLQPPTHSKQIFPKLLILIHLQNSFPALAQAMALDLHKSQFPDPSYSQLPSLPTFSSCMEEWMKMNAR